MFEEVRNEERRKQKQHSFSLKFPDEVVRWIVMPALQWKIPALEPTIRGKIIN